MIELGDIIFKDGTIIPYGKAVYTDEPGCLDTSDHNESFINEILKLPKFYLSEYTYDKEYTIYHNAVRLATEGLIFIFNNKDVSTNPDSCLIYAPVDPTEEQLLTLQEFNNQHKECKKEVDEIITVENDYKEYNSLDSYIKSKTHSSDLTFLR